MDEGDVNEAADVSALASLIGEPVRARMLTALMGGTALTATELALHGEVAPSTASSHLAKLTEARILSVVRQGRHRYYRLFDDEVATMLEHLATVAAREVPRRSRVDPALAAARVCYDHLAGAAGVRMTDALHAHGFLGGRDAFELSAHGERFFSEWGIDVEALRRSRRALTRTCLDWTERRFHLGGLLGAAILERIFTLRWARRETDSRAVLFSTHGQKAFEEWLAERIEN